MINIFKRFIQHNRFTKFIDLLILLLVFIPGISFAQWVNNPAANTKLVSNLNDPINISAYTDKSNGNYIFWEDKKDKISENVYFLHVNENGVPSFRTDGKLISSLTGKNKNPVVQINSLGEAVVLWKNLNSDGKEDLFAQKLTRNGSRLWENEGIKLTNSNLDIVDYSLSVNSTNNNFAAFLVKEQEFSGSYSVGFRKISDSGNFERTSNENVYSSNSRKSKSEIIIDTENNNYIFWLENFSGKSILRVIQIDNNGIKKWDKEPLNISNTSKSVLSYSLARFGNGIHITILYQGQKKEIVHQVLTKSGSEVWGSFGKTISTLPGSQINPQTEIIDADIFISWTNESKNDKNIFLQKFDKNGNGLFKNGATVVLNSPRDEFGQRITEDKKGNIIVAWIGKRNNSGYGNVYVQKFDISGNKLWDSSGVELGSYENSQKSYLNLLPDGNGGAVAIFKEKRDEKSEIFGQKIFSSGTYASQVLGLNANVSNQKVKITWYAANESDGTIYKIERTVPSDTGFSDWRVIASINASGNNPMNQYEYFDEPNTSGTLYYRLVQTENNSDSKEYNAVKVNYFGSAESITLAQNDPNPFNDKTVISFYLPEEKDVSIEFFDQKIELIKQIPKSRYSAGRHEINFNSEGLQPGVYFYRFKSGDFIEVKKMVITPN